MPHIVAHINLLMSRVSADFYIYDGIIVNTIKIFSPNKNQINVDILTCGKFRSYVCRNCGFGPKQISEADENERKKKLAKSKVVQ
jgi:hypothetical protein